MTNSTLDHVGLNVRDLETMSEWWNLVELIGPAPE
jgi:hypothetical protein